jgi:hypothetical protein
MDPESVNTEQLYEAARANWESIDLTTVNNLVNGFAARIKRRAALSGDYLNGHRKIVRAFEEGQDIGNATIENETEGRAKVMAFIRATDTLFGTWERFGAQERYHRLVELMESLPITTKTAIGMPDGHWPSSASNIKIDFNSVSNSHKTVHSPFPREMTK